MKKTLATLLALVMLVSMCSFAFADEAAPQISIMTIKAGASFPDGVTVGDSIYLQELEKLTGFDIEWSCFNEGSADELRMLLASEIDVPDLFQFGSTSALTDLARAGAIAPLDEALVSKGAVLLDYYPENVLNSGKVDGQQFWLMRYLEDRYIGTIAVRKDVLDQLGAEVPTTIEGWGELFDLVKEQTNLLPYGADGNSRHFAFFAHAMDVTIVDVDQFFVIEDGQAILPILSENGYEYVAKMHEWYEQGYLDPEFLIKEDMHDQFLAGNVFAAFIDYTQAARNMSAFYETNPEAEVVYVAPPVSPNGLSGQTCGNLNVNTFWAVPASKADKAELAVEFLSTALNEDVVNLICYGIEGENWEMVDGTPTYKTDNMPVDYRGYYSRLLLNGGWDEAWEASMGVYDLCRELATYVNYNDIGSVPAEGMDTYYELINEVNGYIHDEILRMIVEGVDEAGFKALEEEVMAMGGSDIIAELNEWQASK